MITSEPRMRALAVDSVEATGVEFQGEWLTVVLKDAQRISVDMTRVYWLKWLLNATPQQRACWSLEPGGYAIFWDELDDGVEVEHLLELSPISNRASALRAHQ
jgi:hypothetical protein